MVNPQVHHQSYLLNKLLPHEQINNVQHNKFKILPSQSAHLLLPIYSELGPSSSHSMDHNQSLIMYLSKIYHNTLMNYLAPKTMHPLLLAHMQHVNSTCLIHRYPSMTSCQT